MHILLSQSLGIEPDLNDSNAYCADSAGSGDEKPSLVSNIIETIAILSYLGVMVFTMYNIVQYLVK